MIWRATLLHDKLHDTFQTQGATCCDKMRATKYHEKFPHAKSRVNIYNFFVAIIKFGKETKKRFEKKKIILISYL